MNLPATGWPDLGRLGGRFSFGLEQGLCTKLQTFLLHVPRVVCIFGNVIDILDEPFNDQEEQQHAMFAYTICMFIDRLSISFCLLGAPLNGPSLFFISPYAI